MEVGCTLPTHFDPSTSLGENDPEILTPSRTHKFSTMRTNSNELSIPLSSRDTKDGRGSNLIMDHDGWVNGLKKLCGETH